MKDHTAQLIATVFGIGQVKPGPGTLASFAALPVAACMTAIAGHGALILLIAACFGLGVTASARHAENLGTQDPSEVVIDEVIGQWIALALAPVNPWAYGLAFVLFRYFDIAKPGPVGWADREIKGGLGIMTDDVIAGALAGLVIYGLGFAFPIFRGH
jgi:phosphatidylglycerophosphatase A